MAAMGRVWLALGVAWLAGCGSDAPGDEPDARARAASASVQTNATAGAPVESFYSEGGKLMRGDENVTALGNDLFGDRVNLYNGAVEFVHADVSLPGNSALPVAAGRRLVTGQSQRMQGHFGDWDLEVPRLHGVFSQSVGWTVGPGVASASSARCSQFGRPPQVIGQNNQGTYNPEEYWHGSFLYMPGAGSQELLIPDFSPQSVQPTGPLASPRLTTKDRWSFYCDTPLQGGGGEGFTAVAPDGTRYRFDWMVSRHYASISKAFGAPPESRGETNPNAYVGTLLKRQEVWILPTEVSDRFGNRVVYEWDSTRRWRLKTIRGYTPGASTPERQLSFDYEADLQDPDSFRISRITDGKRQWRYSYADLGAEGKSLSSVTLPGGGAWTMNLAALGAPGPAPSQGGACDAVSNLKMEPGPGATGWMVHPSGAGGHFRMQFITHGRSHVERHCRGTDVDGTGWSYFPLASDVFSLRSKTIYGAGLPQPDLAAADPGATTWTYAYGDHNASFAPCAGCADTKWVSVRAPDGTLTRYTYGIRFRETEGQLLKVEEGIVGAAPPLRVTERSYRSPAAGPYPAQIGQSPQARVQGDLSLRHAPETLRVITQQGATFTWRADNFDRLARPVDVTRFSSLPDSRSERTIFADLPNPQGALDPLFGDRWVLGAVKSVQLLDGPAGTPTLEIESHTYHPGTLNRQESRSFGRVTTSFEYHADGNLWKRADALGQVTRFENYRLGLATDVVYADGSSEHADVDDWGLITAVRNAAGTTTVYAYDDAGRLSQITPPREPDLEYLPTQLRFEPVMQDEVGLSGLHWRQTVTTGNAITERFFDALWRPVLTRARDIADPAGTSRAVIRRYDPLSRMVFESYPQREADLPHIGVNAKGTRRWTDALGRPTLTEQDAEFAQPLRSSTEYLPSFRRRITNPRGFQVTQSFQAFDAPSEDNLRAVEMPEGVTVGIGRDAMGKPTSITRAGANVSVTRSYVYGSDQRLCKTIEPETGATVQLLDAAGNLRWRATGQSLPAGASCDHAAVPETAKIKFSYDLRNRLKETVYGDGSPGVTRTYTPDGLPETVVTAADTNWTYRYNNRRLLKQEIRTQPGQRIDEGWTFTWGINAYGHVSSLSYPWWDAVYYSPDALGQPRQVSGHASQVTYHPNGTVAGYTLANGISRSVRLNARQLPEQWRDATASAALVQERYSYDANGNVTGISDEVDARYTRSMTLYDGLDRLREANGIWGAGRYEYDAIDNLTRSQVGTRSLNHEIDRGTNRLQRLSGSQQVDIDYDANGNVSRRGAQAFQFDIGNRLFHAVGKASYTYDGHGRRAWSYYADGSARVHAYSLTGKLLLSWHNRKGGTRYVYLGDKLIAENSNESGTLRTTYVLTDALGSPVVRTDESGAVQSRTRYEPYGATAEGANPKGVGFTGHANDEETGLVYAQQRYYDPAAGRFLSVDPVSVGDQGANHFGRYHYAYNNPLRFTDPDGRVPGTSDACKDNPASSCTNVVVPKDRPIAALAPAPAANAPGGPFIELGPSAETQLKVSVAIVAVAATLLLPEAAPVLARAVLSSRSSAAIGATTGTRLHFDKAARTWTSPQGLVYGEGSNHGNRVLHVLDHAAPNPTKPVHSVFAVDRKQVLGLLDEAWAARVGLGALQSNGNRAWVIDMGRKVGSAGETSVRIVVRDGTNRVITAHPQ